MKRRSKPNFFNDICDQPYSDLVKVRLYNSTKNSSCLLERLSLVTRLPLHTGCVNTVSWNETGRLLLSGADDQRLVITHGHTWKFVADAATRHRANIFGAAFLPGSDSRVVSCAGDGSVIYTDFDRLKETRDCLFSCHSGTAYQVAVVPGDPHSFLSCGEDGTVRCRDLRIKNCCARTHCYEDILLQCPKAVTSMAINNAAPYQLAVGSADSHIRLFDRRMIYPDEGELRPTASFTAAGLGARGHRITSLTFAPEGQALLASFLSDHLFLFNIRDQGVTMLSADSKDNCKSKSRCRGDVSETPPTANAPLRRLRLRGDWSDTGPDARPEREGGRNDNVSELSQGERNQHSLMQRLTDVLSRMLTDPATRAALNEGRRSPPDEAPPPVRAPAPDLQPAEATRRMQQIAQQWRRLSITSRHQPPTVASSQPASSLDNTNPGQETPSSEETSNSVPSTADENATRTTETAASTNVPNVTAKADAAATVPQASEITGESSENVQAVKTEIISEAESNVIRETSPALTTGSERRSSVNASSDPGPSGSEPGTSFQPESLESDAGSVRNRATQTRPRSSQLPAVTTQQADDYQTLAEAWMNQGEAGKEVPDPDVECDREQRASCFPIMQIFKGHRNSRTMIKQACFWGTEHVMSGSDCGHVFAWRRDTGRLVALFPGDLHVVNCLQPHPTLPLLASSGIDHDVKIWAPVAERSTFDQAFADNLMQRNQVMLEETRDTITVPASFMIRMLACLNQMHRGGRAPRRPTEDDAE